VTPRGRERQEKRERIVEAAARAFARKGYAGTVVADIAAEAGIGKGTIYEYFRSKEDLFFAVFEWLFRETRAEARVGIGAVGGSTAERLESLSDSLMRIWTEIEDFFTLTMEFWAASSSSHLRQQFKEAFRNGYAEFRTLVSNLIREGVERGEFRRDVDPDAVGAALVGAWDALFLQAWFDDDFDPVTTAQSFMAALINGLRHRA
jgi:AcrR family transcriptional regulator